MTRINCVPVQELTDKHLLAEYRELPRVFKLARRCPDAPKNYTLGAGHVKFFYDKLLYCQKRQVQLYEEMKLRGFKPKYDPEELWHYHPKAGGRTFEYQWEDWAPTPEALEINRNRIGERILASKLKKQPQAFDKVKI
jgi:hypothetical protein